MCLSILCVFDLHTSIKQTNESTALLVLWRDNNKWLLKYPLILRPKLQVQIKPQNTKYKVPIFQNHRHWLCCFFQESLMSAYTTVKDKLQDTGVYVTMHHCRWCRDISLAHLQTKQRDKEQQCHSNQIKYVLSTEVSRKNRPEHYLDNTVKTAKLRKTHHSVGGCYSWQSFWWTCLF